MVKHVLFVKLKDNSQQECQKLKELFLSMKEKVEAIRDLQVGIDFLHSDRSYDVVLEIVLDSPAALEEYQAHPYHADIESLRPSNERSQLYCGLRDGSNRREQRSKIQTERGMEEP